GSSGIDVYSQIQKLRLHDKFLGFIQEILDDLYDDYKHNLELFVRYFRFIVESRHSPNFDLMINYRNKNLKYTKVTPEDLEKLAESNPLNYIYIKIELEVKKEADVIPVDKIKKFVDIFGLNSLFNSQSFIFVSIYYSGF